MWTIISSEWKQHTACAWHQLKHSTEIKDNYDKYKREDWILPRMKGPALLALFPEILVHSALDLAEVSPESLSDALLFILYLEKESDKRRMHGVKCCLFICSHVCLFPFNIVSPPTDFTVGSWTDTSPSAFNSTCTPYCTTVKRKNKKVTRV